MKTAELEDRLRKRVLSGLHVGEFQPGERLPSIRTVAAEMGQDHRAVAAAYRELEKEGLVEIRPRSGVFLTSQRRIGGGNGVLPETASWVSKIATEGWLRRIPLDRLPELIRRCTAPRPFRCACVESLADPLESLLVEVRQYLGLEAVPVEIGGAGAPDRGRLAAVLEDVDLVLTTAFHAPEVRAVLEDGGPPLVVLEVDPDWRESFLRALEAGGLVVVAVDTGLRERLAETLDEAERDALEVVTAAGISLSELDESRSIWVTPAAEGQLDDLDHPGRLRGRRYMSERTARNLIDEIVRLSLEGGEAPAR